MGELLKRLKEYTSKKNYPMHMPGHKRNTLLLPDYDIDITEIDGFDNLHQPEGLLKECMDSAAAVYNSRNSYFLVNGSTCGLQAAIYASTNYGDKVIVARNCHKSVYNMLVIRGLNPVYVDLRGWDEDVKAIEEALENNSSVSAVIVTSPFYDGRVCNVRDMAKACHNAGKVLIVDEAHGAHLPFCGETGFFPESAMYQGADLVIQSLHKTLPAMTQTAILHRMNDRVDEEKLKHGLSVFQSSSPSYVLMASIDECISYVSENREELFENYIRRLCEFYNRAMKEFPEFFDESRLMQGMSCADSDFTSEMDGKVVFDPGKILLCGKNLSMTGKEIYDILLYYGITPEMWAGDYCLCMTSVCDTEEALVTLADVLTRLATDRRTSCKRIVGSKNTDNLVYPDFCVEQYCSPASAEKYGRRCVTLEEVSECLTDDNLSVACKEFVCGAMVAVYPPGAPVLVPGEYVSKDAINYISKAIEAGNQVNGLVDGKLAMLDI